MSYQDDESMMRQAGMRADRRRRLMVGALLLAMVAMILIPVVQAFV